MPSRADSPEEIGALRSRIGDLERRLEDASQANAELRQSVAGSGEGEQAYRQMAALSPDAVFVHDRERRILYLNAAGATLFGAQSAVEIVGRNAADFIHPDSREDVEQRARAAFAGEGGEAFLEQRRLRLDGSEYVGAASAARIAWDGQPAVLVILRDLSGLKRVESEFIAAEMRSQHAETLLQDAIETMSEGFAVFDAEDRLQLFNSRYRDEIWPQVADILVPGVKLEAIARAAIAKDLWEGGVDKDTEALVRKALERHRKLPSVDEMKRNDGRWIRQSKRRTANGGVVAVYADITDIKRREQALAESEERHRRLLETLPDAVIIHSGGKIAYVNPEAVKLLGASDRTELIGRDSSDFIHPDCAELNEERKRLVLEGRRTLPLAEQNRVRLDGSVVEVGTRATFIQWNGKPAFLGVMRDLTERKAAEAQAEKSRRWLLDAIHSLSDGFALWDGDDRLVIWNGKFMDDVPGREEILVAGRRFDDIVGDVAARLNSVMDGGETDDWMRTRVKHHRQAEGLLVLKNPAGRWIQATERRTPEGFTVGIYADVTERQQAEQWLQQSEERYRRLVELSPDAVYVHCEGTVVFANRAAGRLFGAGDADRVVGLRVERMVHEESWPEVLNIRAEIARTGRQTDFVKFRYLRPDGSDFPGEGAAAPFVWQGRPAMLVVVRDSTDRVQAETALRESEERYRTLVDLSPDAIYVHSQGRIVFVNSSAVTLYGARTADDIIGREPIEFTHPEDRDMIRERTGLVLSGTATSFAEHRRLRLDGSTFWASTAASPLSWEGTPSALVVSRDITVQRLARRRLQEAKETAEFANRTKSEFLANMSHELRTPLNAVIGFSEILKNEMFGPLGNENYRDYVRDIHDSGAHLLKVINDILDLSKIEAGRLSPRFADTDLRICVDSSVRIVKPKADENGVDIEVRIADDIPVIRADERMVKQILMNLLSNAVKFTPEGGKVRITAVARAGDRLEFSVIDSGIGIAEDDIAMVMEPFGQVEGDLDRKFEGTGLGLPLTKSLVELHGGELWLRSKPGRGTKVTVSLPLRPSA